MSYQVAFLFGGPSVLGVIAARGIMLPMIPENLYQVGSYSLTRDTLILVLFALLMLAAGLSMLSGSAATDSNTFNELEQQPLAIRKKVAIIFEGLTVGILTGCVGAGGGFIIVPVLVLLLSLPSRIAIGTPLAIISAKSILGVAAYGMFWRDANWSFLFAFTSAAVIGIVLGGQMANRIPAKPLKIGFGRFVLLLGIWMLSKELWQ